MKSVGIVAEYNPYHRGHKYHLEKTLEMTGAECAVTVMSGNFTQRGELSPWDKWQRSESAVIAGINLVLELPFVYAVNRGEIFAQGAVDILAGMGVDYISFGSESGDIDELTSLADELETNADEISRIRKEHMSEGYSFAASLARAVEEVEGKDKAVLLKSPNNILALEYIKRIKYWDSKGVHITPVTVKRHGSGYFEMNDESGYAGASQIRDAIAGGDKDAVAFFLPEEVRMLLEEAVFLGPAEAKLLDIVKLDTLRMTAKELRELYCMGEGLESKFKKEAKDAMSFQQLIDVLTSRRYTASAMRRLVLYMAMNLKWHELPNGVYGRVLAADGVGRELVRQVKNSDNGIEIITNINKEMPVNEVNAETLAIDIKASDIYNFIVGKDEYKYSDYVKRPFIL
ncbi:MAG: nucleotidyltransferase family protein [Firmicutes bacterium]|nr:nucleotidyltransferase family protein [Bacillota bacterium]